MFQVRGKTQRVSIIIVLIESDSAADGELASFANMCWLLLLVLAESESREIQNFPLKKCRKMCPEGRKTKLAFSIDNFLDIVHSHTHTHTRTRAYAQHRNLHRLLLHHVG